MFPVRSRPLSALVILAVTAALSGCAPDPQDIADRAATVTVLDSEELGEILVDGKGAVLYIFKPDDAAAVSCTFTCATNWPPFTAVEDAVPVTGDGVEQELLGTMANPAGGEVVTYNGWPLYRYAADRAPGEYNGQDRYLNGGEWYVIAPDGEPVIP